MGLFISFEGGEGTGKSTQVQLLSERLKGHGYNVVVVHEPGGTELGDVLRGYLKAVNRTLTPEAELFLFVAARSELVRRMLRPALAEDQVVLADRYADSTIAYQGYGRRLPLRAVRSANELATDGLWPDLTVLLDLPPEQGLDRARLTPLDQRHLGRPDEREERRFEEAGIAFHRRVRAGYLKLAARAPKRWVVVEASGGVEVVAEQVWQRVEQALGMRSVVREARGRLPGL